MIKLKSTAYRKVTSDDGKIYLFDLYLFDGSGFYNEPVLLFELDNKEICWDNSEWVCKFLKGLKKNKKSAKKELKEFCQDEGLNFKETMKDLKDIYSTAKLLKFFKR